MRYLLWEVIPDIAGPAFVLGFVIMELDYVARIYQLPHNVEFNEVNNKVRYVEIKCQLDATDDFYCRSYCLLNVFRTPLCPSSGAREY